MHTLFVNQHTKANTDSALGGARCEVGAGMGAHAFIHHIAVAFAQTSTTSRTTRLYGLTIAGVVMAHLGLLSPEHILMLMLYLRQRRISTRPHTHESVRRKQVRSGRP